LRGVKASSISELEREAREVLRSEPRVALAYLFGSVARGTPGPLSDIDLGVLLAAPAGRSEILGALMDRLVLRLRTEDVDLVDLAAAPFPLRYRVVREGRVVVCVDPRLRERFEVETVRRYLDFQPLRQRAFDIARAVILRAG